MCREYCSIKVNLPLLHKPTWQNTIHANFKSFNHVNHFATYASLLGYPYFLWNDRIYKAEDYSDTGFTIEELNNA